MMATQSDYDKVQALLVDVFADRKEYWIDVSLMSDLHEKIAKLLATERNQVTPS